MTLARNRKATRRSAVRQIADFNGANASLNGSSTKTCQPSESIVWYALKTFVPSGSRPIVAASASASLPASAERGPHLRQRGQARAPEEEVGVRMGDEHTSRVDGVRIPGCPDARPVDDVGHEAQVDVGNDDAAPRSPLGHRDRHVGLRPVLEVDRPEIPFLRSRPTEFGPLREVDPAAGAVNLERVDPHLLPPRRVEVPELAEELLACEQPVEILLALGEAGRAARGGRLRGRLEIQDELLHELRDRGSGGERHVALDTGQRTLAVLIREVELRETERNDRGGNERHDDARVLPFQASVRPDGRFHVARRPSGRPRPRG